MAFTSVKDVMNKKNNHLVDNCRVIIERFDQRIVQKKRGRPKKLVTQNKNASILLNCDENSVVPNSSDFKTEVNDLQAIEKKCLGKPKEEASNKSNKLVSKKKKKRKRIFTKIKKRTVNKLEDENKEISQMSSDSKVTNLNVDYEIPSNENIDFVNQVLNKNDLIITQPDLCCFKNVTLESCDGYINSCVKEKKECTSFEQIVPLDFNEVNWNIRLPKSVKSKSVTLQRRNECINSCVADTNIKKPDIMSLDLNKVNWDMTFPKRGRSKSFTNYIVEKPCEDINEFENLKLKKYSKSLSYLDPGPNIHIKRYDKYELMKIYKSKLRRIRTYPNCLSMDSSALNFLVTDMDYRYGAYNKIYQNEELFSDNESSDEEIEEEIYLIKNITKGGFNREYRSKSVPLEQREKYDYIHRSIDNLEKLCDINDLLPITFNIPSDKCDNVIKNIESNLEECNNKIRRSKRLNTKVKPIDLLEKEYLLKCDEPKFDYLMLAQQIRQEHERQLSEARKTDEELENKLKKLDFTLITNNIFRPHKKDISKYISTDPHEIRKVKPKTTNNIDTFNCHCKYTKEDQIQRKQGCGSECLNRLLNIECGPSCSLMSICTNKQFQNKQFKRTEIVKTPNKGYGLFALEDIPSGTFVDEYIGEVIDHRQMIKRLQTNLYIDNNYMVQLKHDVIIDATCKGNITRFINHSCEPNCVAEKWNVLGESRMGFFSKKLIKKGDEITFDYSFEIFGATAQQKCYCGAFKCRGFISKKCRNLEDNSSSDENDYNQNGLISTIVPKKKTKIIITNYDKNRLHELDRQLTDISKVKNKNRSDLENSTLNLNKLMVHITDSISRLHILKFIRENDLNCKKLFMSFNGLSILHSWMVSNNNNEIVKLEIIRTLSDLPISNRNTISKSKVLDVVADWANIPKNIKNVIENLEFPILKKIEHASEVNRLFPDQNNISPLIQSARNLWKKWIVLKMVFKIPKLDRPKVNIPNAVDNPLIVSSHQESNLGQFNLDSPSENRKTTPIDFKNKLSYVKYGKNQTQKYFKSDTMNRFNNIFQHRIRFSNQHKNHLALEWNKKNWESASKSNNLISNSSHGLNLENEHQEIPVICGLPSKKTKWNTPEIASSAYEIVPTDDTVQFGFNDKIFQTESEFYPITEIITTDQICNLQPPSIVELNNESTLKCVLNMTPYEYTSNLCNERKKCLMSYNKPFLHIMKPENLLYDGQHPSIKNQTYLQHAVTNTNHNLTYISNTDFINTDTNIVQPKKYMNWEQCMKYSTEQLHKRSLDKMKSAKQNYSNLSLIKSSSLKRVSFKSHLRDKKHGNELVNLLKRIKIISNGYRNQPSRIIKINNILSQGIQPSSEILRADEDNKIDSISLAFKFHNEQLITTGIQIPNIKKLLLKQSIDIKHENKFANKILNALVKNAKKMIPNKFSLKLPPDTEIITLDPTKEIELHHNLIPTVKNSLCAILKKDDKPIINLFKQNLVMEHNKSTSVLELKSILKQNSVSLKSFEDGNATAVQRPIKRKLPLSFTTYKKRKKIVDVSQKNVDKSRNETNFPIGIPDKNDYFHINDNYSEKKSSTSNKIKNYSALKTNTITSSQNTLINFEETNDHELKQKPCMKCLPFQQINGISDTLIQNNIAHLATCADVIPTQSNNELINPIVDSFKNSIGFRGITGRSKFVDDPIVKDYIERMQLQAVGTKRKYKLPESLMSLPIEVLDLVPDNQVDIKHVTDFYHNMATVIVKILDSYAKKNCKQGRIRNDADFKYLAKKLNSNILYKELQAKRIHELRITEHMKQKVKQYIITYMLKFGKVYRNKSID